MDIKKIWTVQDWNHHQRSKGNYILIYTRGNGAMIDPPRLSGFVAQNNTRSHFYQTKKEARENIDNI